MSFPQVMTHVAEGIEALGVALIVGGLVWSLAVAGARWRSSRNGRQTYRELRELLGGVLLLGVEILVAADIVRTVTVSPSLNNVAGLGLIVLIRTFLSLSLQVELEGRPPWRRVDAARPE